MYIPLIGPEIVLVRFIGNASSSRVGFRQQKQPQNIDKLAAVLVWNRLGNASNPDPKIIVGAGKASQKYR